MSAVDTNTLRAGDVVLVRATVQEPRSPGRYGWIEVCGILGVPMREGQIVSVEPRPLAVGDIVKFGHSEGELKAIDPITDEAWVRAYARNITVPIRKLVRA